MDPEPIFSELQVANQPGVLGVGPFVVCHVRHVNVFFGGGGDDDG